MTERIIRRVVIRGRVQGVGFRYWLAQEAHARAIEGWARNRRDGSVEAVFAGPSDAVAAILAACRRGPPSAHVDALDVGEAGARDLDARKAHETFSLLPTV